MNAFEEAKRPAGVRRKRWLLSGFLAASVFAVVTRSLERLLVYHPVAEVAGLPTDIGLDFRDVHTRTSDGITLHGWFVPCDGSRVTFILFHGNAGNIGHRLPWIERMHRLGAHVLIFNHRGFGDSEGSPFENGLYEDALAAWSWWKNEIRAAGSVAVLAGESLGGAVAIDLASKVPASGLVVQSTFTSMWDMSKTIFPLMLLQPMSGVHYDSAAKIGSITCPKLIIHGDRDNLVPFRMGERLYELAAPPKELYRVAGAGHNDLLDRAGEEYLARLEAFLEQIPIPAAQKK